MAKLLRGVLYVGTNGGTSAHGSVFAFKADCGTGGMACSPLWSAAQPAKVAGHPAFVNGRLYFGAGRRLIDYALD